MASLYSNEQLPTSSEEAIRKFDEKYLAVISIAPPSTWADRFVETVDSPRTTYPLSIAAGKFRETKEGSSRFQDMGERAADLKVVEYDNGYEVKLINVLTNTFAYRGWSKTPELFRAAEARHYARLAAAVLEAGTSTTCAFDGVNFFSASHLSNPNDQDSTTWSNYNNSGVDPLTIANIATEMTTMRGAVLDVNGDKMIAEPDEIWLPTAKFQGVSDKLNQAFLASGESNYMNGKLKVVHIPELTDANDWYLVDSKLLNQGLNIMTVAKYMPSDSLGLRFFGEDSDFFKTTGKLKVSNHIWSGAAMLFPHAIRRIAGA